MSTQRWLQYFGIENGNPIYSESLIDVPKGWVFAGNYAGTPVYIPPKTLEPIYPSAPLATVAPQPTRLPNSPLYPTVKSTSEPTYDRLTQKRLKVNQMMVVDHDEAFKLVANELMKDLKKKAEEANKKGKIFVCEISDMSPRVFFKLGDFLKGVQKDIPTNLEIHLVNKLTNKRTTFKGKPLEEKVSDITVNFKSVHTITQEELFTALKNRLKDKDVIVPLTLAEQIDALSFSANNEAFKNQAAVLEAWKTSLKKLLEEEEQVQIQVEKTQDVIRAIEKYVDSVQHASADQTAHYGKLTKALEEFEENILALSGKEIALMVGVGWMLTIAFVAIGAALIPILSSSVVLLLLIPLFVIPVLGSYLGTLGIIITGNAIGADAAYPPSKEPSNKGSCNLDFISPKLTELGFFGNTPRHKARNFIEEVKKVSEENQSQEAKQVEQGRNSGLSTHMRV